MDILWVQKRLAYHGFNPGPLDGVIGPKTKSAIISFKRSVGLKARWYVGPITTAALRQERKSEAGHGLDNDPVWLRVALSYLGLKEIKGPHHEQQILSWWEKIKMPFRDDETPWCAAYVGGVLEECGIRSTRSGMARSYTKFGMELDNPARGAIVTFWRGKRNGPSGHVGFVMGKDANNNIMVLGGNQGDEVSIKPFAINRVLSYHWPRTHSLDTVAGYSQLALLDSDGVVSTNEA